MISKINEAIVLARKMGLKERVSTLNMIKSELVNNTKAKTPVSDDEVVLSYLKKLEKSAEMYVATDKLPQILGEILVVKEFAPVVLSSEDAEVIVESYKSVDFVVALNELTAKYGKHNKGIFARLLKQK